MPEKGNVKSEQVATPRKTVQRRANAPEPSTAFSLDRGFVFDRISIHPQLGPGSAGAEFHPLAAVQRKLSAGQGAAVVQLARFKMGAYDYIIPDKFLGAAWEARPYQ